MLIKPTKRCKVGNTVVGTMIVLSPIMITSSWVVGCKNIVVVRCECKHVVQREHVVPLMCHELYNELYLF